MKLPFCSQTWQNYEPPCRWNMTPESPTPIHCRNAKKHRYNINKTLCYYDFIHFTGTTETQVHISIQITLLWVIPTMNEISVLHRFWNMFWHYFWTFSLAVYLAYILAFFLAYFLTLFLALYLAFYMTYILAFFLANYWHSFWHSFSSYWLPVSQAVYHLFVDGCQQHANTCKYWTYLINSPTPKLQLVRIQNTSYEILTSHKLTTQFINSSSQKLLSPATDTIPTMPHPTPIHNPLLSWQHLVLKPFPHEVCIARASGGQRTSCCRGEPCKWTNGVNWWLVNGSWMFMVNSRDSRASDG